ncbi:MBL fold metallo-hydrolase [Sphingomonas sinipercae]|uniref:MBL fold metallo-hydrolase n=1 Tax=Sphingomonas sinipercae TaxID=2714944 RepID=A0A6G7ZNE4_9SPHN|nr:MBL fold metallo-hydrolase [Sphingomonas sinipercae]QIL02504.1 MBL fold metallo-hydrolase [Sphingomonas sinipercae]
MKLRILGCGTSAGVPRIGPDWGQCDPQEPRNRRTRCSVVVESGRKRLLVDCGPDLRQQLLAAEIGTLDAVVVTHDHADHCHGIDELRTVAQHAGGAIPLYARPDVVGKLGQRFGYAFNASSFYIPVVEGRDVAEFTRFGSVDVAVVDQPHGEITSLGLRFEEGGHRAVYAIDFHEMTPDMATQYEAADVMICDCLQRRPHPTHAHLDAVLGWARELRIGALYLSHMNNSMDYRTLVAELPDWAAPAFDGLEIAL